MPQMRGSQLSTRGINDGVVLVGGTLEHHRAGLELGSNTRNHGRRCGRVVHLDVVRAGNEGERPIQVCGGELYPCIVHDGVVFIGRAVDHEGAGGHIRGFAGADICRRVAVVNSYGVTPRKEAERSPHVARCQLSGRGVQNCIIFVGADIYIHRSRLQFEHRARLQVRSNVDVIEANLITSREQRQGGGQVRRSQLAGCGVKHRIILIGLAVDHNRAGCALGQHL